MINLKEEVEKRGYTVVHIKTDSIKVENPDDFITNFINEYGKKYGYEFEVEDEFDRVCLINDAEFIAYDMNNNEWFPKGDRFKTPYTFKTLFSHEPVTFDDLCLTCSVTSEIDLDFNENKTSTEELDKALDDINKVRKYLSGATASAPSKKKIELYKDVTDNDIEQLKSQIAKQHDYKFVGRVGRFVPIKPGCGGGILVRRNGDKFDAVQGTKGYRWMEAENVRDTNMESNIDTSYWITEANNVYADIQEALNKNLGHSCYSCVEEFLDAEALPF